MTGLERKFGAGRALTLTLNCICIFLFISFPFNEWKKKKHVLIWRGLSKSICSVSLHKFAALCWLSTPFSKVRPVLLHLFIWHNWDHLLCIEKNGLWDYPSQRASQICLATQHIVAEILLQILLYYQCCLKSVASKHAIVFLSATISLVIV